MREFKHDPLTGTGSGTCQIWWTRDVSSYRGVDVDDTQMYVSTSQGEVIAITRRTGQPVWSNPVLKLRSLSAPAVVGVMFLGDHARPGLGGVAVLGFSLAIVCAVALARFGEADEKGLTAAQRGAVRQAAEREPSPHTAG